VEVEEAEEEEEEEEEEEVEDHWEQLVKLILSFLNNQAQDHQC
jgi:hypothetical protein